MPARSKGQQRLFGMALAVRRGEMKRSDVWDEVLDIVDSDMTDKEIEDFAKTKHDGLKEHYMMKSLYGYITESKIDQEVKKVISLIDNYFKDDPHEIFDDTATVKIDGNSTDIMQFIIWYDDEFISSSQSKRRFDNFKKFMEEKTSYKIYLLNTYDHLSQIYMDLIY